MCALHKKIDPVDHFCSKLLTEGGAHFLTPGGRDGMTSDMAGRWTIKAYDTGKKDLTPALKELIYKNNAGVMEVVKFFDMASPDQIMTLRSLVEKGQEYSAWKFIEKVLNVRMMGDGPWKKKDDYTYGHGSQ